MKESKESCSAKKRKGRRYAVGNFRRAVTMKIAVEDSYIGKTATMFKRLRLSVRGGELMRQKAFDSILFRRAL